MKCPSAYFWQVVDSSLLERRTLKWGKSSSESERRSIMMRDDGITAVNHSISSHLSLALSNLQHKVSNLYAELE